MKKSGLLMLVLFFLLLPLSKITEAKLSIIPPKEMIEQSSLIVIGTVTKKEFSEEQREVSISVEKVLKGNIQEKVIDLKREKPLMYGWLNFDFPETGTKILIFLQQSNQLTPTGDANAIAVLDGNNLTLYKGSTMGQWTPKQYEEAYQAYLDLQSTQNKSDTNVPNFPVTTSYKMNNDGVTMPSAEAKPQVFSPFNTSIILGGIGVVLFFIYLILKRKRPN